MMDGLTIGKAAFTGVTVQTVRAYHQHGLIDEPRRDSCAGEMEVGIRPGSAARLEVNAKHGTVQNLMEPVDRPEQNEASVQVYARNSFGNIIIRHATAV